jgi:hypothetical protein
MRISTIISVTVFALLTFTLPALADACSDGARAMVNGDANATLLSVKSVKGSNGKVTCEARIKITSSGSAPRVVVKKFKP